MAACVELVSLAAMRMEKETESVVTCSKRRPRRREEDVSDVKEEGVCGSMPIIL
jgi:hypothetical protein